MESRAKILSELNYETEHYSPHTRSQYFSHVENYLDFVGNNRDWRERDVLHNYVQKLKKLGHSQNHINYIVRGPIGAIFRAFGLRIPIKLPRVPITKRIVDITSRVRFTPEEMAALVQGARATGREDCQAIFAVATIYGPRAGELLTLGKEHIQPKKNTITIITEKYGFKREHVIPAEIKPYIINYDFPPGSHNLLYEVFSVVCYKAGVERVSRKAFHAIRHGLIDALKYQSKMSDDTISKFMGWSPAGMVGQYARPFPFLPEIDEEIFEKHPFLEYWGVT